MLHADYLRSVGRWEIGNDEMCRDDRCQIEGIHGRHHISWNDDERDYSPEPLEEIVLRCVSNWECRLTSQICRAVLDEYGPVSARSVQRALAALCEAREILLVMPRGTRRRIVHPYVLALPGGQGAVGAYIRATSPHLLDPGGVDLLADQVEDLLRDRSRHLNEP